MIDQVDVQKMHHRNAPDTEIAAAHKVARSLATGLSLLSIRPRISELLEMKLVEDTFTRHTNTYGNTEIIWKLTKKGEKYVH